MKITFLGVSGALSTEYNSNMLIEHDKYVMLFDCGEDVMHSLKAAGRTPEELSSVYISHLHFDHMGGLSWLGYYMYFVAKKRITLYIHESLVSDLWAMLRPAMEKIGGMPMMTLRDYFYIEAIKDDHFSFGMRPFGTSFQLVRQTHVETFHGNMYSYGLQGGEDNKDGWQFFISSDTKDLEIIRSHNMAFSTLPSIIFSDVDVMNLDGVHPNYNKLVTLDPGIKEKIWLYHYHGLGDKMPDAVADGFAGFVKEGQVFEV